MRELITRLSTQLPQEPVELAKEMVNANEAPIALDIVSEMLVERRARLDRDVFDEIEDLAAGLGLDAALAERLRPLLRDD